MNEVVVLSAARSPICDFQGSLASKSAVDLGAHVAREALQRSGARADKVPTTADGERARCRIETTRPAAGRRDVCGQRPVGQCRPERRAAGPPPGRAAFVCPLHNGQQGVRVGDEGGHPGGPDPRAGPGGHGACRGDRIDEQLPLLLAKVSGAAIAIQPPGSAWCIKGRIFRFFFRFEFHPSHVGQLQGRDAVRPR